MANVATKRTDEVNVEAKRRGDREQHVIAGTVYVLLVIADYEERLKISLPT